MKMETFAEMVCTEVGRALGREASVEVRKVRKNNGVIRYGLMVRKQGCNVSPTVYLDTFQKAYESGTALEPIVRSILDSFREPGSRECADMEFFRSFERVRDRICYRLIGRKGNEALLEEIPYIEFLDLAACFYYAYDGELGDGTILIHNSHMETWGSNVMELFALSRRNTPRLLPWECSGLQEIVQEVIEAGDMGSDTAVPEGIAEAVCGDVPMMVLTNKKRIHGAACMLYPGVLEEMAHRIGKDFFILPSSIHEVILLPDTGKESSEALEKMIREVNSTQVAPEDVLSDTLYRYDSSQGRAVMV